MMQANRMLLEFADGSAEIVTLGKAEEIANLTPVDASKEIVNSAWVFLDEKTDTFTFC